MSIFLSQGQTVAQGQGEGRVGKVSHVMGKRSLEIEDGNNDDVEDVNNDDVDADYWL